ncbi:unnamed protein product [Caenorhabditis sp. 36 PRJEB53466]|nr:unnamed protein product [Caenorhabditis sp. 36 PRJEB53466]
MAEIIALAGCTNSGKSTLAKEFQKFFGPSETTIINQDEFYKTEDEVEKIYDPAAKDLTKEGYYWSFDEKEAIHIDRFRQTIVEASKHYKYVILDGNMITEMDEILELCDRIIVMTLDVKTCRRRREARTDYVPPDSRGYFDHVAFPAYLRHLERARHLSRTDARITFIDVSESRFEEKNESIVDFRRQILNDHIKITSEKLDVELAQRLVADPTCGAISTFNGVTRNHHSGRRVESLSYDCHDLMAYKKLRAICQQTRTLFPDVSKIVIFHRIGVVGIGDSSVLIATSSPHRKSAISATEKLIDLLKEEVPIFKYELYSIGNQGAWKSNVEDCKNVD